MKERKRKRNPQFLRPALLFILLIFTATVLAAQVKIMPLGDSITAGQGFWRAYLWDALQTNGYTNIDFVGSVDSGGCSVEFDSDCEGHGGIAATGMADNNQLPAWLVTFFNECCIISESVLY